jgi:hypothetical protein
MGYSRSLNGIFHQEKLLPQCIREIVNKAVTMNEMIKESGKISRTTKGILRAPYTMPRRAGE